MDMYKYKRTFAEDGEQKTGDQKPEEQKAKERRPVDQKPGDQKSRDQRSGAQNDDNRKYGMQDGADAGPSLHFYDHIQMAENPERPLDDRSRLRSIHRPLLAWYETHARVLPWREDPQPYRVWISEIMLQQTRVEAVKPYFERFMRALPDVEALASVEDDRLMKLWEGLGYYNRARNLKKAAVMVMDQYGGRMPSQYEELVKLPGIGSYTAGAVASIAFGQAVPAVDGNVLRVISRVLASREDILKQSTKTRMENLLRETMPGSEASHFNQGLIEVGAIVCVPNGEPKCAQCPLSSLCLARARGLTGEIPVKTPAKKRKIEERTVCILEYQDQVAIHKREDHGLLASLYELPNAESHLEQEQLCGAFHLEPHTVAEIIKLPAAKHVFSHVEWHMIGYRILLNRKPPEEYLTVKKKELKDIYPLPNAFGRYTKLIK